MSTDKMFSKCYSLMQNIPLNIDFYLFNSLIIFTILDYKATIPNLAY